MAMGTAVGVFVAFTPTIPFHTILTIALAFVFRGSKPAALIIDPCCDLVGRAADPKKKMERIQKTGKKIRKIR